MTQATFDNALQFWIARLEGRVSELLEARDWPELAKLVGIDDPRELMLHALRVSAWIPTA